MEDVLKKLFDHYLQINNTTFEQFINDNQHDLYHFFMNKDKCCYCSGKRQLRNERILNRSQYTTLFDVNSLRKTNHNTINSLSKLCCFQAKSGLQTDVLDFTLLRILLVNLCEDLFWSHCSVEHGKGFPELLLMNKHDIYHLFNDGVVCCQCRTGYDRPVAIKNVDPKDLRKIFLPKPNKRCQKYCSCSYDKDTTLTSSSLRKNICRHVFIQLTNWFCPLRKQMEIGSQLRNDIIHKNLSMSDEDLTVTFEKLETCAMQLSRVANCEETISEKFNEIKSCSFDNENYMRIYEILQTGSKIAEEVQNDVAEMKDILLGLDQKLQNCRDTTVLHERQNTKRKRIEETEAPSPSNPQERRIDAKQFFLSYTVENLRKQGLFHADTQDMEAEVTVKLQNSIRQRTEHPMEEENTLPQALLLDAPTAAKESDGDSSSESGPDEPDRHMCGRCGKEFYSLDAHVKHKSSFPRCRRRKCVKRKENKNKENNELPMNVDLRTEYQVRMEFKCVDSNWHQTADERIRTNPQCMDTDCITTELSETGSLVVWAKIKTEMLTKDENLQDAVGKFVKNMVTKCPINHPGETTLAVKIDVVSGMEDSEEDENDTFKCGRCGQIFHQVEHFCSHKRHCKRRSVKQEKEKEILKNAEEQPKCSDEGKPSSTSSVEETSKNTDEEITVDVKDNSSIEREKGTRHKVQYKKLSFVDNLALDTEEVPMDDNVKASDRLNLSKIVKLQLYPDEIEMYESKFNRPVTDISRGIVHAVRKRTKKKQKPKTLDQWLLENEDTDIDNRSSEYEQIVETSVYNPRVPSKASSVEESYFEQSLKRSAEGLGEDSNFMMYGLDLDSDFISEITSTFKRRREKKGSFYDGFIDNTDELEKLLKSDTNKYRRGLLEIEASHVAKCKTIDKTDEVTVIDISGRSKCGKAYSDDEVVVEVLGTDERSKGSIQMLKRSNIGRCYGKVIGIVKKNRCANVRNPVFICEIDEHEFDKAKPLCKTVPKFHLLKQAGETDPYNVTIYDYSRGERKLEVAETLKINIHSIKSYLFYVVCLAWDHQYPVGAIFKVHQSTLNFVNCMDILKLQYKVPILYSPQTTYNVENIINNFNIETYSKGRLDLRNESVFTIDPEGSTVFDDAISIKLNGPNKTTIVGVHIADVASVVQKGTDLDNEALRRVTTYFPGQFLNPHHLLPEPLSRHICSLNEGEDKLAFSIFFTFDKDKNLLLTKTEFCKSIIKSKYKLTYKQAQQVITDSQKDNPLKTEIKVLHDIAKALKKKRMGASRFWIPVEADLPGDRDKNCSDAYSLIEQFMILTNSVVAIYLMKVFPDCVPLRCHEPTADKLISDWIDTYPHVSNLLLHLQGAQTLPGEYVSLRNLDDRVRPNDIVPIQKWLWKKIISYIENGNIKDATELICSDELHPLQALALAEWEDIQINAEYRCSGKEGRGIKGHHSSLRLLQYVHFTSPIRRYIDIVTQRLLHSAFKREKPPYQQQEVSTLCAHVSFLSKNAGKYRSKCKEIILGDIISRTPLLVNSIVEDFTESEIIFVVPGIKFLHKKNRTLLLRHLVMCSTPQSSSDMDQLRSKKEKSKLSLFWRKRIYSAAAKLPFAQDRQKGYQKPMHNEFQKIDPKQNVVFLRTSVWINTIRVLTSGATNSQIKNELKYGNVRKYVPTTFGTELDINSEIYRPDEEGVYFMFPEQFCKFSHTFNHGQVLSIQISAEMRNGCLTNYVDFLDLTQNIKFCLRHMRNPVSSFGIVPLNYVQDVYKDSKEYKDTWIPIMQMEAAFAVVRTSGIVINDVFVTFDKDRGNFVLKASFCYERNISLNVQTPKFLALDRNPLNEGDILSGTADYLCVRTCIKFDKDKSILAKSIDQGKYFWIGHAIICRTAITNRGSPNERIRVYFKLTDGSTVPECLRQGNGSYCSIEILQRTEAEKRTEVCVQSLNKADPLAKAVALHKDLPEISTVKETMRCEIDIGLPDNNSKQSEAIRKALKNSFCLIHGPPGTGKTYTCIKLINLFHQMNKRKLMEYDDGKDKILVSGPSNKSVDLIARRLRRYKVDGGPNIIRFYGTSIEQIAFGIPGQNVIEQHGSDYTPDSDMNEISVHHLVRQCGDYSEEIRSFEDRFKRDPYRIDSATMLNYRNLLKTATIAELRKHDVILCTTSMATSPRLLEAIGKNISQLVIDESGMCTEPESIASIIASRPNQVTLIGDHKQLRPIVMSKYAADLGLQRSLFERYSESLGKAKFVQLDRQYRMHHTICKFPSEEFYRDTLKTEPSKSYEENPRLSIWLNDRGLHREERHVFCHIEGIEEVSQVSTEDQNEHSFKNMKEVDQVMKILRHLHRIDKVFTRENRPSVNVMSQYNAQCNALLDTIKREKLDPFVDVHTVVSSQGGEWDYVIFSMVRSLPEYRIERHPTTGWCKENLGFITDQNQINVALTRAKKGLFLIGNEKLLTCDPVLKKLIEFYRMKNCVVDCTLDEFPRHKGKK